MSDQSHSRGPVLLNLRRVARYALAREWRKAAGAMRAVLLRGRTGPGTWVELGDHYRSQKRWYDAIAAYETALAMDDRRPYWLARLGRTYQRAKRWDDAISAYERAVSFGNAPARWYIRLANVYERTKRWEDAIRAYEAAVALDGAHPEWYAMLGLLYQRTEHDERAADAFRQWLDRDRSVSDLDRRLLSASSYHFAPRQTIAKFIAERLPEIRERARTSRVDAAVYDPKIFLYWGQGFAQCPPVVRLCQRELLRHHSDDEVVLLDDALVPYYVRLPDSVHDKIAHDRAKFSDVLRVALLAEYGGIWMDATCLVTGRVLDHVRSLPPNALFAYTYRPARIASWYLASEPGGYMVTMMREANYLYWEHFDRPVDYYYFHHLFEALYYTDEEFRAVWEASPRTGARRPHRFQKVMYEPYDPVRFDSVLGQSPVHKLSHKVQLPRLQPGSHLAHLVRHGPVTQRVPEPLRIL